MGPGLFESVYEAVIEYEVVNTYKLKVESQKSIPVVFLWFNIKSYFLPLALTLEGWVDEGFKGLAKRWLPILNEFETWRVDVSYEIHQGYGKIV